MKIEIVNVESIQALTIKDSCTAKELSKKYQELYSEIGKVIKEQSLKVSSMPFGIYHSFSLEHVDVEAGIPVEGTPKPEGRVNVINTYSGNAARATFIGPYEKLGDAWDEFFKWMGENGFIPGFPCYEIYVTDPANEADNSKWQTDLYFPLP
ncbi:MAG: GyrI-like domain-containing protein [Ignavibacteria bacterium]